ncbi:MAG: AMP-binding protein [Vulcanococcus sp.]
MSRLQLVIDEGPRAAVLEQLQHSLEQGAAAALVSPQERGAVEPALAAALPADLAEAAVVLGSGGSSGARRWCLQPLSHLEGAAQATAHWLEAQGISPQRCELFNPLPPHHISGLMPWIRSRCWGSSLRWLAPELMRDPAALAVQQPPSEGRSALLSLVPTQLERLLEHPAGRDWLQGFALIWVGGAALSASQAQRCRQWGIRLSPCYGSTETGAMVAALAPEAFLQGAPGCGEPLSHVQLRLDPQTSALQVRSGSLARAIWLADRWQPLPQEQGWWSSGDRAALMPEGLQVLGRLDGAIQSGGETVFPEQLEAQLLSLCQGRRLPVAELLLLAEADPLWGERLVALVRLEAAAEFAGLLPDLQALAQELPPSQRPRRWLECSTLERTALGKWERQRWHQWLALLEAA